MHLSCLDTVMRNILAFFILEDLEATFGAHFISKLTDFFMFVKILSEKFFVTTKVRALHNHVQALKNVILKVFPLDLFIAAFGLVFAVNCQFLELINQERVWACSC